MDKKNIENIRFLQLRDTSTNWIQNNPFLFAGEIAIISDLGRIKLGTGDTFSTTSFFGLDRWNVDITNIPAANDENIKPAGSIKKNIEDFLNINGEIVYPINLTTSVKLADGTNLQQWIDENATPTPLTISNITIATSAWDSSKRFYVTLPVIKEKHSPDVRFAKDSISPAAKANIIAYTEDTKLVFECSELPTVNLVVEVAILTLIN